MNLFRAARDGVFSIADQLALALDGLCRTPEPPSRDYQDGTEKLDPDYEPTDQQVRWEARQVAAMAAAERLASSEWSYAHYNAAGDLIGEGSIPSPAAPPAAVADSTPKAVSRPEEDAPSEAPSGHQLDGDEVVAAFIASEEKRDRLHLDLVEAFNEYLDIDWAEIVYALLRKYDITPKK